MKPPIDTIHLFTPLNQALISLLKGLSPSDWQRQTIARQWQVKDVVAHLLDGNCRRISLHRDGWFPQPDTPIGTQQELVVYLNGLNADWVKATRRLSPVMLIEWLESTNNTVFEIFSRLDPFEKSVYPVSWAGETLSYNWFDIAREYTERWLHQQQIRDVLGDESIMNEELYHPFLNVFMQAWPFTLKNTEAAPGTKLKAIVSGKGGGEWLTVKENGSWKSPISAMDNENGSHGEKTAAETIIDGRAAWKLFSKSVRKEDIQGSYTIKGDQQLGAKVLEMVSVMA